MCSTTSPKIPTVPHHPRRRFDSSSKTRSGEEHRTPIGSRSRWDHRGDVRDARRTGRDSLARCGSGKWTSSSLATRFCATEPALRISTAKPTVCTARYELVLHIGNFLGVTASVPGARLRLHATRRLASPLQRHGASQRSPLLVKGRRRFVVA